MSTFASLGLSDFTLQAIKRKGFEEPTPIQAKVIPLLLEGNQEIIGQAHTGTGKTAAFGLPLIERLEENSDHVQALIVAPTRELAVQIAEEINSLKGGKQLDIVPVYGGQSYAIQLKRLRKGVDIVVGTPGRLMDHIRRKTLTLDKIDFLILDEADEMLNMGFIEDIEFIMAHAPEEKKTLLFSATMPERIKQVAAKYMKNQIFVSVKKKQLTVALTDQIYFEVKESDKFEAFCQMVDMEDEFYGLVFCRTKIDVDTVASRLIDRGYDAEGLHGDISQALREKILNRFKKRQISILVATDVAARGLDVIGLTHVVNYALPQDPESYIHRIGRTGRAGEQGTAVTFITPSEYRKLGFIKKISNADIKRRELPTVEDIIGRKKTMLLEELGDIIAEDDCDHYKAFAWELLETYPAENLVAAFLKHAYRNDFDPGNYRQLEAPCPQPHGKTRLFVAMGKRHKKSKIGLIKLIERKSGVHAKDIRNLEMYDDFSFINVEFKAAKKILRAFAKGKGSGRPFVEKAEAMGKYQHKGFQKFYPEKRGGKKKRK